MRSVAALTALSCLLLAGCGGSDSEPSAEPGAGATLEELWRAPGDDVAVIPGTATYEPGAVRVSFLVIDAEGALVALPTARVWVANGLESAPFLETEAKLERIGIPGGDEADATHIYVTTLRLPRAGKYWFVAEPDGGAEKVQALGNVVVAKEDAPPDVGDSAVASKTPTLASTAGDTAALTTRTPPDETLLRYSVADSIAANVPFVVTFSTPKFCSSRTCGPVVDVVEEVSRRFEDDGIRFIHVEVFEDNDPAKGFNRWMQEWKLSTEPWTFLVGADGKIAERFEGTVSVNELEQAVREKLAAAG
ncbi:MAG TPA: thioredoxin family protein [Gaiellaceae bacterium]|nr:thioredoxin family protein [Gaiellaceae bacterium]